MQGTAVVQQGQPWEGLHDPKYRCCCGCCSVLDGARVIGILEAIGVSFVAFITFLVLGLAQPLYEFEGTQSEYYGTIVGLVVFTMFIGAVIGALIYGVQKERPAFIIPHIVVQVICLILLALFAVIVVVALAKAGRAVARMPSANTDYVHRGRDKELNQYNFEDAGNHPYDTANPYRKESYKNSLADGLATFGALEIMFLLFCAGIQIWFLLIILKAYKFLKEKQGFRYTRFDNSVGYPMGPGPSQAYPCPPYQPTV